MMGAAARERLVTLICPICQDNYIGRGKDMDDLIEILSLHVRKDHPGDYGKKSIQKGYRMKRHLTLVK